EQVLRQGYHRVIGAEADGRVPGHVEGAYLDASLHRPHVGDEHSPADPGAGDTGEVIDEPAIALGPGDELGGLLAGPADAGREVEEPRVRRGGLQRGAVVVAAGVLDPPAEAAGGPALLLEEIGHGDPVERVELGRVGALGAGDGEGPAAAGVAESHPA